MTAGNIACHQRIALIQGFEYLKSRYPDRNAIGFWETLKIRSSRAAGRAQDTCCPSHE